MLGGRFAGAALSAWRPHIKANATPTTGAKIRSLMKGEGSRVTRNLFSGHEGLPRALVATLCMKQLFCTAMSEDARSSRRSLSRKKAQKSQKPIRSFCAFCAFLRPSSSGRFGCGSAAPGNPRFNVWVATLVAAMPRQVHTREAAWGQAAPPPTHLFG